jgi:diacylglycerol O-acyltransferase / wax synthase
VLSYMDNVDIGFMACRELVPDVWDLADHVQDAMDELLTAIEPAPATSAPATKGAAKKRSAKKKAAPARKAVAS